MTESQKKKKVTKKSIANRETDRQSKVQIDRVTTNSVTDRQKYRHTEEQTDRRTDKQLRTDKQKNRRTEVQTDKSRVRQKYFCLSVLLSVCS